VDGVGWNVDVKVGSFRIQSGADLLVRFDGNGENSRVHTGTV
jgi:hypothetical protein